MTRPLEKARPFWVEHWPIVVVALAALAIRLIGLSRRYLIYDEALLLDPAGLELPVTRFAVKLWLNTNYSPCWPILVWFIHRIVGVSQFWARFPSAFCGALTPVILYASAREFGLKRLTAVLAGLIAATAIHQIEYGQQIMPHVASPLVCSLCIWLVTRLAKQEVWTDPASLLSLTAGLIAVFGMAMCVYNSSLLLIPLVLGYWAWALWKPLGAATDGVVRGRRLAMRSWVVCMLAMGFISFGWFLAKLGHSDWNHLRPFFLGTFRQAPDRSMVSDTLRLMDVKYLGAEWTSGNAPVTLRDGVYFTATRLFDFVYGEFRMHAEQHFSRFHYQTLLPLVMVLLAARGAFRGLRGAAGPAASRWAIATMVILLCLLPLSALRMFPIGGIRHLIVLSPLAILLAAAGLESSSRRFSAVLAGLCLIWVVGSVSILPYYYQTTRDRLGLSQIAKVARQYGVHDLVAADTICSEGALQVAALEIPDGRMIPADDEQFAQCTAEHRPFFLCALSDSILTPGDGDKPPVVTRRLKTLAHPLANLRHYRAIPLAHPVLPQRWIDWTIFYMEPRKGPYSPEVVEVEEFRRGGQNVPSALVLRFSKPIRPESINVNTVQLATIGPKGFTTKPWITLDMQYSAPTQTLVITPRKPLADQLYMLSLDRRIVDLDGRPLDGNGTAFYHLILDQPTPPPGMSDRGWVLREQQNFVSSKL